MHFATIHYSIFTNQNILISEKNAINNFKILGFIYMYIWCISKCILPLANDKNTNINYNVQIFNITDIIFTIYTNFKYYNSTIKFDDPIIMASSLSA